MSEWTYRGEVLREAPEGFVGFVYLITSPEGRKYVGKKLLTTQVKRKPLKGKTRNRRSVRESDWQKYYGSSRELTEDLARTDAALWKREVLHFCRSKWEAAFVELKVQMALNVLADPSFYNGIIHVRLRYFPSVMLPIEQIEEMIQRVKLEVSIPAIRRRRRNLQHVAK